jgi:hypothetical protein
MDTRDVFAAVAMHALLAKIYLPTNVERLTDALDAVSEASFTIADMMVKHTSDGKSERSSTEQARRLVETLRKQKADAK